MAGFTAINEPSGASHPLASSSYRNGVICRARSYEGQLYRDQSTLAVADFQGDRNTNVAKATVKQTTGPLCGLGSKKTASAPQGKKRKGSATIEPNGKRRKISDVAESVPVTKPASRGELKNTTRSSKPETVAALHDESKPCHIDSVPLRPAPSVSVVAPQTSMNTFHPAANLTALDAVRSSPGHSTTVYQGSQVQSATRKQAQVVQPWLNHASSSFPTSTNRGNTNSPQRQKAVHSQQTAPATTVTTNHAKRTKVDGLHNAYSRAISCIPNLEEDFLADDHDINLHEAFKLTQQAENTSKQPKSKRDKLHAASELQRTGGAIASGAKLKALSRKPTTILTPEEELMQLADDDEAELMEVTVDAEQSYRDKKLNLRNVDPNEDYGGLLLSDAERNLLGRLHLLP